MVFSDTTAKNGILQMCEQTTNLGDTGITGNSALKAYFTNLINQWLQIGHFYAWTTNKDWHFDDFNYTTFPFATTTVVDSQRDYSLPSTLYRVRKVEIMDIAGKYHALEQFDEESPILVNEKEQETPGIPTHYRLANFSLILYPVPDITMVTAEKGLRLSYDREMNVFTMTDTTQVPGFAELLHPICYYGPCWEWAMVNNVGNVAKMCERMLGQFPGLREVFEKFFSVRDKNDISFVGRPYKSYK